VLYANGQPEDLRYVAAVLNSRVLTYRFRFIGKLVGGGTYEYFHYTVDRLAVPRRRPGDLDHDALVVLAAEVAEAKAALASADVAADQESARRRAQDAIDRIEDLVGELFGLTAGDRAHIDASLAD
jgi:hypothetical protein